MALFHISCNEYKIGETLVADNETLYFLANKKSGKDWVDLILNEHKPNKAPNREFTYYAFDFIGNCFAFFKTRKCDSGQPFYYKVEMKDPIKVPMCLTDLILKEGQNSTTLKEIATEYWNPKLEWKYCEYLSSEMTIIEILPEPNAMDKLKGQSNYQNDYDCKSKFIKNIKSKSI